MPVAVILATSPWPGRAAIYQNGTDLNQAVARARPYIAANGGPAVTVETHRANGTVIDRFSGSLLSSPDGQNRTVVTAAHGWLQALAADTNAYALVLTGTNFNTDRGLEIRATEALLAPGADGSLNTCDLCALKLPYAVTNTGVFVIGQSVENAPATTTGVGFRLTQEQLANGTYAPVDGNFARWDGPVQLLATFGSDYFLNAVNFNVGAAAYPFGAVSAGGNSGAGTFITSSFQFDGQGRITHGEYIGSNVGHSGNRLASFSQSLFTDANNPVANAFLRSVLAIKPALTIEKLTSPALRLTWDAAATGYRLQTSEALPAWTDLGSVLTGPGTYDDPTTNRPYRFYRLAKP